MRSLTCLLILTLFASGCATSPVPGRAEAVLDASEVPGRAHAEALAGDDLEEARATGLRLLTVLATCWGTDEC